MAEQIGVQVGDIIALKYTGEHYLVVKKMPYTGNLVGVRYGAERLLIHSDVWVSVSAKMVNEKMFASFKNPKPKTFWQKLFHE